MRGIRKTTAFDRPNSRGVCSRSHAAATVGVPFLRCQWPWLVVTAEVLMLVLLTIVMVMVALALVVLVVVVVAVNVDVEIIVVVGGVAVMWQC